MKFNYYFSNFEEDIKEFLCITNLLIDAWDYKLNNILAEIRERITNWGGIYIEYDKLSALVLLSILFSNSYIRISMLIVDRPLARQPKILLVFFFFLNKINCFCKWVSRCRQSNCASLNRAWQVATLQKIFSNG
jgi:hypothetical protein